MGRYKRVPEHDFWSLLISKKIKNMKIIFAIIIFLALMKVFIWAYKYTKKEMKCGEFFWSIIWSAIPAVIILLIF